MNHKFSPSEQQILLDELYKASLQDLYTFMRATFQSSVQGRHKFKLHWSAQELCEYLELAAKGEIEWLLISLPRGWGKSLFVSEYFPAWCLLRDPSERIGCFTRAFTPDSKIWHENSFNVYNSAFSKNLHTNLHEATYSERIWRTKANGYRRVGSCQASSVGSDMTKVVIDDPHSEEHERSEALQLSLNNFYRKGIFPAIRTVDDNVDINQLTEEQKIEYSLILQDEQMIVKKPPTLVHCMQRLHQRDMQGILLEIIQDLQKAGIAKNAHYYHLPAQAPEKKIYSFPKSKVEYVMEEGEYLEAGTLTKKVIEQHKIQMGDSAFQAQMQQDPQDAMGTFFKREWFRYEKDVMMNAFHATYLVFDTAFKTKEYNDPTGCVVFGLCGRKIYVLEAFSKRVEYPVLLRMVLDLRKKWEPTGIIIEDKGSGQSLIQSLAEHAIPGIISYNPEGSKEHRISKAISSLRVYLETGCFILPDHADWKNAFEKELLDFPNAVHDEYVDCCSMFMNYISEFNTTMLGQNASDWIW